MPGRSKPFVLYYEAADTRRDAVREALASHGLGGLVTEASSLDDVSQALAERPHRMVIAGESLPGQVLDAVALVRRTHPDLPILVLSDAVGEQWPVQALRAGASDWLRRSRLDRLGDALLRADADCAQRFAARRAREALAFSARASAELAGSLDCDATLDNVVKLAVPYLADFAAVDLFEEGELRRRTFRGAPELPVSLAEALAGPFEPPSETFWAGHAECWPELPEAAVPRLPLLQPLAQLGLESLMRLPLVAQGRPIGALILGSLGRPPPEPYELAFAEDYARRAALALDAALTHQQLRTTDQRKDEFLAMLAHELRNPLASVLAALELLRARGGNEAIEVPRQSAERQGRHMARILDDLLDVSRITQGKIELRRQPLELSRLVREAAEVCRRRAEARGQRLELETTSETLPVFGDPDRIEQVLSNILGNAMKFTPPGGQLSIRTEQERGQAVVRIRDSGVGIPREMLPRVFDLFVQGSRSLERGEGGLGLGLTLSRQLVELHGGALAAHSEGHGKGSEFVVRLPLARGLVLPEPAAYRAPEPDEHRPLHVLLVDDNDDLRTATRELLRMLEHEVHEARDGHEALLRMGEGEFDVAVIDLGLPGLSGYSVAQAIREREEGSGRRTVLVALTGYGQPEHRRRTRQAGFDEHLTKPLEFDQLRALLSRVAAPEPTSAHAPSFGAQRYGS